MGLHHQVGGAADERDRGEGTLLKLFLLGPIRIQDGTGSNLPLVNRRAQAVLTVLALSEGATSSRRRLAALLWSRIDVTTALARLRDVLHDLRRVLPGIPDAVLRTEGDQVSLVPGTIWIDAVDPSRALREDVEPDAVAAELIGIDPALDDWLSIRRVQWRGVRPGGGTPTLTFGTSRRPSEEVSRRVALVGVCPLKVLGPGVEAHLPFAIAEEVSTALAKLRSIRVVSSASVATVSASGRSPGAELGLSLLLEGTLQRAAGRLRVSLRLIDVEGDSIAWSSRFEHSDDDLFALQDEVAASVAASLEPEIPLIEAERVRQGGPSGTGSYGLVLRAIPAVHQLDHRRFIEAGELLQRAVELEPDYAAAHAWLALWSVFLVGQNWSKNPTAAMARAGEAAERAITLDPGDARGLTIAGHVRAYLYRRPREAAALHRRALEINPSLSIAWMWSGMTHAYLGDLAEARRCVERCCVLAPRDPHAFLQETALTSVELLSRDHAAAAERGRRATQTQPQFSAAYKPYLAALGHLGSRDEAAATLRRLLELEPGFSIKRFRDAAAYQKHEHIEHYVGGLRAAGLR